mgnify:CR=1 FL=1
MAKRLETTNNSFTNEQEQEKQKYISEMQKRDDIIMILC